MYGFMMLAQNAPLTGDNFPATALIIIAEIAVVLAVVTTILSNKNK